MKRIIKILKIFFWRFYSGLSFIQCILFLTDYLMITESLMWL